jgi:8-oxo-dGTP pyrophosphatase MutT (NUDIX family)
MTYVQIGVKLLVIDNTSNKFLAVSRSNLANLSHREIWDIPGGRLVTGEALLDGLAREVFEEIGYKIIVEPIIIDACSIIRNEHEHIVRLTYSMHEDPGNLSIVLSDEHLSYSWIRLNPSADFHPCLNHAIERYNYYWRHSS